MSQGLAPLAPETLGRLSQISTQTLCPPLCYTLGFKHTFRHGVWPHHASARLPGEAATPRFVPAREATVAGDFTAEPDNPQRSEIGTIQPDQVSLAGSRRETKAATASDVLTTRLPRRGRLDP
ncbi:MAG: hypothetical protein IT307_13035 [Chloroflexi bacterium]|nr:hypothetical protein [Chloroflexota bacterium]